METTRIPPIPLNVRGGGMVEIAVRLRPPDTIQTVLTLSRRLLVPCCFSVVDFGPAYLGFVVLPRSSATGTLISPFKPV